MEERLKKLQTNHNTPSEAQARIKEAIKEHEKYIKVLEDRIESETTHDHKILIQELVPEMGCVKLQTLNCRTGRDWRSLVSLIGSVHSVIWQ